MLHIGGQMAQVRGQSIVYVRIFLYLCIVFRDDLNTRKRDVRSANEMRTKMNRNNQDYESRIDYSYRKFTRYVEEGWLLLPDMQRAADCATVSKEMDRYASTKGGTREVHCYLRTEESKTRIDTRSINAKNNAGYNPATINEILLTIKPNLNYGRN